MTPQDQEFLYIPDQQYGDCMRACVASLLDLRIALVPHFLRDADGKPSKFWEGVYDFLEVHGWDFMPNIAVYRPHFTTKTDGYHVMVGPSPRGQGIHHAVVGRYGVMVFDPHPSRAGLAGDPSEWTYGYLVKA